MLVSTLNEDDSPNVAPMSSAWWLGTSAMLGVAPGSQTNLNLRRSGECVLNVASSDLVDAVDLLAPYTAAFDIPARKLARGYTTRPDKFARRENLFGSCAHGAAAFEVEIVVAHDATHLQADGSGRLVDVDRWDPLVMKFCEAAATTGTCVARGSVAPGRYRRRPARRERSVSPGL